MTTQGSTRSHWCSHTLWTLMKYAETHLNQNVHRLRNSSTVLWQRSKCILFSYWIRLRNTKRFMLWNSSCFQFYSFYDIRFSYLTTLFKLQQFYYIGMELTKTMKMAAIRPASLVDASCLGIETCLVPRWNVKYGKSPHRPFLGTYSRRRRSVRSIEACKIVLQLQARQPLIFSWRD
jgi:hypothetical protein